MNAQEPIFEGILLVDKPAGITSHDIVDRLRRKLKMKKIGHAGTLDPLATGLMIMLIGKATKVSQFLISLDKRYEGEFLLGVETDSQDSDGQVVQEKPVSPEINEERVKEEMKSFLGDDPVPLPDEKCGPQIQLPPGNFRTGTPFSIDRIQNATPYTRKACHLSLPYLNVFSFLGTRICFPRCQLVPNPFI